MAYFGAWLVDAGWDRHKVILASSAIDVVVRAPASLPVSACKQLQNTHAREPANPFGIFRGLAHIRGWSQRSQHGLVWPACAEWRMRTPGMQGERHSLREAQTVSHALLGLMDAKAEQGASGLDACTSPN